MPAAVWTLRLEGFEFPTRLDAHKANFRFLVDVRLRDERGRFDARQSVMPSLDTFWECDPGRKDRPNYVRGTSVAGRRTGLDLARIDEWDRLILAVRAESVDAVQVRVFDVNRRDGWDRALGVLRDVVSALMTGGRRAVPGGDAVERGVGEASEDLEAWLLKRLAGGGDTVLYRGSVSVEGPGVYEIGATSDRDRGSSGRYRFRFSVQASA